MIYCRHCGNQIHETARTCPSCGGEQSYSAEVTFSESARQSNNSLAVASLIFGLFAVLVWFDDSHWDTDTYVGVFIIFILPAFVLSVISLSSSSSGREMAIFGLVMSIVSFLALLGSI